MLGFSIFYDFIPQNKLLYVDMKKKIGIKWKNNVFSSLTTN